MPAGENSYPVALIRELCSRPSIEAIRQLEDLNSLVHYVFTRAGFKVMLPTSPIPATFELYDQTSSGQPVGYVLTQRLAGRNKVGRPVVERLQGQIANGSKGYIITNTSFVEDAKARAQVSPRVNLLDLNRFKRFIEYVMGTRDEGALTPSLFPDAILIADSIERRDRATTRVLTIANNKGGEGKTTSALYLAKLLGEQGQRILLVDLDVQANVSETLPPLSNGGQELQTLVDYFQGRSPISSLVRKTHLNNVWIVPSTKRLRLSLTGVATSSDMELKFVQQLHSTDVRPTESETEQVFDWMIIDTPPDMTLVQSRAAIASAHYVLAPTSPGPYSESGLKQLFDTSTAMRGLMGGQVRIVGCLVTKWQGSNIHKDALNKLNQDHLIPRGVFVMNTKIPYDPNIARDERGGLRILGLGAKSGAASYRDLVKELMEYDDGY